jgi:hypothetical protein
MRYVCLCYYNHAQFEACSPEDMQAVQKICAPRDAELNATGRVILNSSLGEPSSARTLRADKNGEATVIPGPYAQSAEPLGALFLIEAADLDEAVRIARIHPGTALGKYFGGGIEVRSLDHFVLSAPQPAPIGA